MIGVAAAHWSFRFVVVMPFTYEIGSPEWRKDPKWLDDEEKQWQEEEEELRLCGWKGGVGKHRRGPPRIASSPSGDLGDIEKAQVSGWVGGWVGGGRCFAYRYKSCDATGRFIIIRPRLRDFTGGLFVQHTISYIPCIQRHTYHTAVVSYASFEPFEPFDRFFSSFFSGATFF